MTVEAGIILKERVLFGSCFNYEYLFHYFCFIEVIVAEMIVYQVLLYGKDKNIQKKKNIR